MTIEQTDGISAEFGFYPKPLDIDNERFSVKTLPEHEKKVTFITQHPNTQKNWIYAGFQQKIDIASGETTPLPYSERVFSLPKTHVLTLYKNENPEDLDFVVWCLSFFTGMRLTTITKGGFLDATPIKPETLVDFILYPCSLEDVIKLALDYLESERGNSRTTKRVTAVIHTLFLAQYPSSLPFERFQYLYMVLDTCYKLVVEKADTKPERTMPHGARVQWMCNQFNITIPDWAITCGKNSEISTVRNDTMHESLFFDEPLGFSLYGGNQFDKKHKNATLEMRNLICRLLVCILGISDFNYITSSINDRMYKSLNLR
ncbi:hypothetical protein [Acinetobacter sp. MB5]|uniref:hypothetical protein n=1 Tax=Acinetobacter sp. MB5 TaxID=2069438 RepID=UPI000DCF8FF7|nr:hypothetical protein [Acinetobacter sp. MB5]